MKVGLVLVGVLTAVAIVDGSASGEPSAVTCRASLVHGDYVHAGPIRGAIDRFTDVVDGRFRLHVGKYRDVASGTFQKILWSVPAMRRAGGELVVRGRKLFGRKRTFVQRFQQAGTEHETRRYYPSTIIPPSAGCWRLTLRTGHLRNALVARVDG